MAHDVIYVNPQSELVKYQMDFDTILEGDTTLVAVGAGASSITAFSSAGTDVSSTILSSKLATGMALTVNIGAVTEGEDYRVEFVGKGTTTSNFATQVLEVRARKYITGAV